MAKKLKRKSKRPNRRKNTAARGKSLTTFRATMMLMLPVVLIPGHPAAD